MRVTRQTLVYFTNLSNSKLKPLLKILLTRIAMVWGRQSRLGRTTFLALLLTLLVGAVPSYRQFRTWRAESLAEQAVQQLQEGNVAAAHERANASFQLDPYSAENRRLFIDHLQGRDDQGALLQGHVLAEHADASPADLRAYVAQCLNHDFAAKAAQALRRLLEIDPGDPDNWVLAAEFERARGNGQLAFDHLEKALALDSEHHQAQLLAALIAFRAQDPAIRANAAQQLEQLGDIGGLVGLRALSELLADPAALSAIQTDRLARALQQHPMATRDHLLAAARARAHHARGEGPVWEAILQEAEMLCGPENRSLYYAWLNECGASAKVLQHLSLEDAAQSRDLFLVHCQALVAEERWHELLDRLDPPKEAWPIRQSTRRFLSLQAARALEADGKVQRIRKELLTEAQSINPPSTLITLAQQLEKQGLDEDALHAYSFLRERFPAKSGYAYDRMASIYRYRGNSQALLELTHQMLLEDPGSLVYQHNWAYLSLLRQKSLTEVEDTLVELATTFKMAPSICALALFRKQTGRELEAREMIAPLEWDALSPLDQRLTAVIHGGMNLPAPKSLDFALLPEERNLFSVVSPTMPLADQTAALDEED